MNIAFIGLGNMGAPMAKNLAKAGHRVTGFDLVRKELAGIGMASSAAQACEGAHVVITMLPDATALKQVTAEILPSITPGAILIDCSTVDVDTARQVAGEAEARALAMLDAPVSGGITGAEAGSLTFMVGGNLQAFETARSLFSIMGQKAVHCGDVGAGQAAKICNNMILGITMIGTCEAIALADGLGLDRAKLFDVVSTSSGYSWVMNAYTPLPGIGAQSPADNDYKPGFSADLMLKDLRLAAQAAQSAGAATPLGAAAKDLYQQFVEQEDGSGQDFSAMVKRFEKLLAS